MRGALPPIFRIFSCGVVSDKDHPTIDVNTMGYTHIDQPS
jgi:hypothetical protein